MRIKEKLAYAAIGGILVSIGHMLLLQSNILFLPPVQAQDIAISKAKSKWTHEQFVDWHQRFIKARDEAQDVDLTEVDFSKFQLVPTYPFRIDLRRATLHRTNFEGANLTGTDFSQADLREANLKNANLRVSLLSGANLFHANLEGANLSFVVILERTSFQNANLQGSKLQQAMLTGANFEGANLQEANLENAALLGQILITQTSQRRICKELIS